MRCGSACSCTSSGRAMRRSSAAPAGRAASWMTPTGGAPCAAAPKTLLQLAARQLLLHMHSDAGDAGLAGVPVVAPPCTEPSAA
jgi:hypothetical protein